MSRKSKNIGFLLFFTKIEELYGIFQLCHRRITGGKYAGFLKRQPAGAQQRRHVLRQGAFEAEGFPGEGMLHPQQGAVQAVAGQQGLVRPIDGIASQRMADMGHMHPDLMGTPGLQPEAHQGDGPIGIQGLPVGDAGLPPLPHLPGDTAALPHPDGGVDSAGAVQLSQDNGQVFLVGLPVRA